MRFGSDPHGGDPAARHDFSVNVSPLGVCRAGRRALRAALRAAALYPDPLCARLCAALAEKEGVPAGYVLAGNGAAELIYACAARHAGGRALVLGPTFGEYAAAVRAFGGEAVIVFSEKEALAALEGGGFSLFFVCIPNNPDGALLPRAALFSLLEACVKQGTRMVADACFFDFVRDAGYTLSELCAAGATIVQSLTKSYALAGVRVGYLLASDASALAPYLQPWNLSCFALAAGEACARDRAYLKKMRELVERERAFLFGGLCALGYRPRESYANFLLFSCAESVPAALRARGFAVRVCADFEGLCPEKGKTYVRICVKRRAENKKLLRALAEVTE